MSMIEANKKDWKIKSTFSMTFAMTFNFVLFMVVLQREILGFYFYEINFPFLTGFANYIITMVVLYVLPCIILNYFLIFHNQRYEYLKKRYAHHDSKHYCLIYMLISVLLPIILVWIGICIRE